MNRNIQKYNFPNTPKRLFPKKFNEICHAWKIPFRQKKQKCWKNTFFQKIHTQHTLLTWLCQKRRKIKSIAILISCDVTTCFVRALSHRNKFPFFLLIPCYSVLCCWRVCVSYIIKKNYVSLRTKKKKCDERQNQRALSYSTSSFGCRNKKWPNEWNFHASVILTNSKYCIRFCSFHFFFLIASSCEWIGCKFLFDVLLVFYENEMMSSSGTEFCAGWHVSEFWSANENVEHFEGVCVAFEINRGAYYTLFYAMMFNRVSFTYLLLAISSFWSFW